MSALLRAFLFTDIEGSTRLWQADAEGMRVALGRHDVALRRVVEGAGGEVFKNVGDGVCAVFEDPAAAVEAALEGQRRLAGLEAGAGGGVAVRMAVHAGTAESRGGDWFGLAPTRTARLLDAAHGRQVLVSAAAMEWIEGRLPEGASLRDVGRHRLKDLDEPLGIHQLVHPDLPDAFAPLRTLDAVRHNLPLQPSSFVGRRRELAEVAERLERSRLVTLVGSGGSGKTRLALQAAVARVDAHPDGVWVVRLEGLSEPELVASAIASAVGLAESAGLDPATLAGALRYRDLLIVLDNCEHLIEASAEVVATLIGECAGVRILATSREPLAVGGESVVRVQPLPVPDESVVEKEGPAALHRYDAVRLLVERARQATPEFRVGEANAAEVAELCRRLDGIPLALELAAARIATLGPGEILRRLDARFRILGEGPRTARPRHRTLGAAIEWSHDLLDGSERALFRRLSVFAGGWSLDAAEEVCGGLNPLEADEVVGLLARLVEKSLVQVAAEDEGGVRYALLETIRAYARQRLVEADEEAALLLRHHETYARQALARERDFFGPEQGATHSWFGREIDNLRAALAWALEHGDDPDRALRFAHAMYPWWFRRSGADTRIEGARWLERAVERSRDASLRARGFYMLHGLLRHLDPERAGRYARACLEEARRSGVPRRIMGGLLAVGTAAMDRGEDPTPRYEEALEIARGLGEPGMLTLALNHLGEAARLAGRFDRARDLYREAREASRAEGNLEDFGLLGSNLAFTELGLGRIDEARDLWLSRLDMERLEISDVAVTLDGLAAVAAASGDLKRAARLVGHADVLFERAPTGRGRRHGAPRHGRAAPLRPRRGAAGPPEGGGARDADRRGGGAGAVAGPGEGGPGRAGRPGPRSTRRLDRGDRAGYLGRDPGSFARRTDRDPRGGLRLNP